jgi:hypothetical protein
MCIYCTMPIKKPKSLKQLSRYYSVGTVPIQTKIPCLCTTYKCLSRPKSFWYAAYQGQNPKNNYPYTAQGRHYWYSAYPGQNPSFVLLISAYIGQNPRNSYPCTVGTVPFLAQILRIGSDVLVVRCLSRPKSLE